MEGCWVLSLTTILSLNGSYIASASLRRKVAGILPTHDFCLNDKLLSQTRPFLFCSADHILDTGYWKQSVQWNRKGLACETKPTVCKRKRKQMQRSSKKQKLMVQRSLININCTLMHGLGRNDCV